MNNKLKEDSTAVKMYPCCDVCMHYLLNFDTSKPCKATIDKLVNSYANIKNQELREKIFQLFNILAKEQ